MKLNLCTALGTCVQERDTRDKSDDRRTHEQSSTNQKMMGGVKGGGKQQQEMERRAQIIAGLAAVGRMHMKMSSNEASIHR